MTLAELADSLPNGFHDSAIKRVTVDYEKQTARLEMSLLVGLPDDPIEKRDNCRDGLVELFGLQFFMISAPNAKEHLGALGEVWVVDGYDTNEILNSCKEITPSLLQSISAGVFTFSFYLNDWNSYIHIAARKCSLKWLGPEHTRTERRQPFLPGETIDI